MLTKLVWVCIRERQSKEDKDRSGNINCNLLIYKQQQFSLSLATDIIALRAEIHGYFLY